MDRNDAQACVALMAAAWPFAAFVDDATGRLTAHGEMASKDFQSFETEAGVAAVEGLRQSVNRSSGPVPAEWLSGLRVARADLAFRTPSLPVRAAQNPCTFSEWFKYHATEEQKATVVRLWPALMKAEA